MNRGTADWQNFLAHPRLTGEAGACCCVRRVRGPLHGLRLATATISATFLPHCEQRIRVESAASAADRPAIRASASG
jgi:hypothetical protein